MNTAMHCGRYNRDNRRHTILIIDDDPNNLAIVADYLESNKFTMLAAEDGESGLDRAIYARPDLILLDVMMPGSDGYETCEKLKAMEETRDIPVIFMTALSETGYKLKGFESGAVDYITKPFEREELLARVGVHLRIRELTNRLAEANESLEKRVMERTAELASANRQLREEINERMHVEQALRYSEAKFRAIMETSHMAIVVYRDKFLYVNPAAEVLTGYHGDELLSLAFWEIVHPEHQDFAKERIRKRLAGEDLSNHYEYRVLKKDGTERWVDFSAKIFQPEGEDAVLGIFYDITDRKKTEREREKLQEQLRHAIKMEAIGSLAGGIAHDFNNILTAIMGYGSLLQRSIDDHKTRRYVDEIVAATERATNLTQNLLTFSRKKPLKLQAVNVNAIVCRVENLLTRIIGEEIDLRTKLEECHDMTVMADSGQIEQVLMNLAANARDAMPGGGVLSIETESVAIGDGMPGMNLSPGLYTVITVSDTGTGMDAETRQKLFEPFYTTKEPGKGTGLGLSIVHGIIMEHNGEITVYSQDGIGTTFRIYLKHHNLEISDLQPSEYLSPVGGTETVLIAEDDPAVMGYFRTFLEEFGYNVIVAVNGEEAVTRYKENMDIIQIVLLDVIMPKKSGKTAFEEIREINGDVPVIFWSGYSTELINKIGINGDDISYLTKPVQPNVLLAKMRKALSR